MNNDRASGGKLNIGIFSDTYYPQVNGVVTSIRTLERELTALGHKVFIFTTTDPKAKNEDAETMARVFRMPSMPLIFLRSMRLSFFYPPQVLWKMRRLKLDVIHTQSEFSLGLLGKVVSMFDKLPIVHTYHTKYEDYVHYVARGHLLSKDFARRYSRMFCNRADVVIAPARKTKDSLLDYGVIKPIEVIPTGIDFAPFARDENTPAETAALKASLGIDPTVPVAVYVGRLAKEKSVDVVIRQFARVSVMLPAAKLVVVGGGPVEGELRKLARQLKIDGKVIFTGLVQWADIGKYYRLGDAFVTASTSETQGLTYIEAMAAGTCVVAKRDGATESLIENGVTGFDFVEDDDGAEAIYNALTRKSEREWLSANAAERVRPLSAANFALRLEAVYREAMDNNKA